MNGPDPIRARWRELIDRHLLDELSNDESRELEAALAAHREAREEFRLRCNVDAALRQKATALAGETPAPAARSSNGHTSVAPQWFSWLAWRPLTAAAAGKPLVILDRPNPIRADRFEGNILDLKFRSLVGQHAVALRYGLTVG